MFLRASLSISLTSDILKVVYFIYQNQKWAISENFSSETSRKFKTKFTQYIKGKGVPCTTCLLRIHVFSQYKMYWSLAKVLIRIY